MAVEEYLEEIKLAVKRGPIDNKPRELLVHPNFISFEAGKGQNSYIKIDKSLVKDYRFGIKWIRGYQFTIGRTYQIYIRDNNDQVLKIHFKSLYGIGKVDCHHLYWNILGNLWKYYFQDIANGYIRDFWNDFEFSIGDVIFCSDRLRIRKNGMLKNDLLEIPWDQVRTKDYQTYFVIYAAEDSAKANKSFSYLDDWNTEILHSVVRTIINNIDKKMQRKIGKLHIFEMLRSSLRSLKHIKLS